MSEKSIILEPVNGYIKVQKLSFESLQAPGIRVSPSSVSIFGKIVGIAKDCNTEYVIGDKILYFRNDDCLDSSELNVVFIKPLQIVSIVKGGNI